MSHASPMGRTREPRSGFTLVELLVVIAIIGTLAGVLLPTIQKATRAKTKAACLQQVKGLGTLCMSYADDHRGILPFGKGRNPMAYESFQVVVDANKKDIKPDQFFCPASVDSPVEVTEEGKGFTLTADSCSYAYLKEKTRVDNGGTTILLSDKTYKVDGEGGSGHDDGVNVF